jgi:hypothetical protein
VEAKAATSSKEGTKKYGQPFDLGQHRSHLGVAIIKVMQAIGDGYRVVIAFPDVEAVRRLVDGIEPHWPW